MSNANSLIDVFFVGVTVDSTLVSDVSSSRTWLKSAGMTTYTSKPHITLLKFDSTGFKYHIFHKGCQNLIHYITQNLLKPPLPPILIEAQNTGCFFQSDAVHLSISPFPDLSLLHFKIYAEAKRIFGVLFDKIYRPDFWAPHISLSKENVVIDAMLNVNLPLRGHATSIAYTWHFNRSYNNSVPLQPPPQHPSSSALPQHPSSLALPQPPAATEVIDKVQEETTKSCTEGKPPGVGRGRGSGREDGGRRSAKGVGRSEADEASEGIGGGRGRGGPDGKDGGHGRH